MTMKKFMKSTKLLCLFLCIWSFQASLSAQSSSFTTEGTDFWLAFGQNTKAEYIETAGYNRVFLRIRFVAIEDATISFTFTESNTNGGIEPIILRAGEMHVEEFTTAQAQQIYSNRPYNVPLGDPHYGKNKKSLHIQSTAPISLYAMNFCNYSSDATNVLPTRVLGTDYYHMSYQPLNTSSTDYNYSGFDGHLVVATENDTKIYRGTTSTTPLATLNKGEVYYHYRKSDMTGNNYYLRSDKPVAYFVNVTWANIPSTYSAADILYQQLFPISMWGTEFLVPHTNRAKDRIRIIASIDNTQITYNGAKRISSGTSNTLNKGQYIELELNGNASGSFISSDGKPIAVTAYTVGSQYLGESGSTASDPSMVWIPPLQQSVQSTTIAPFRLNGLVDHRAIIITKATTREQTVVFSEETGGVITLIPSQWETNGDYSFYSLSLGAAATSSYTFNNDAGLSVLMYGYGSSVSYYYLAGSSARTINPHFLVNDYHHQEVNGMEFCEGEFRFDGEIFSLYSSAPENIKWYINGQEETAQQGNQNEWTKELTEGEYTIKMAVKNAYGLTDTCRTTFTVVKCPCIWIGGARGDNPNGAILDDDNKNRWSIALNWIDQKKPDNEYERIQYHELAIDLHADSDGANGRPMLNIAAGIENSTSANLIIPAACALELTGSDGGKPINFTSDAQVIVYSGKPATAGDALRSNGTLILPADFQTEKVFVELFVHSPSEYGQHDADKLLWQYFGIPTSGYRPRRMQGAFVRYYDSHKGHPTDPTQDPLVFWHNITNASPALLPGTGYEIAVWTGNSQTFLFDGEYSTSDMQITLQNASAAQNKYFAGQNVVANPYTGGLNVATGIDFGEDLESTVYIFNTGSNILWDENVKSQQGTASGQYLAVPSSAGGAGFTVPSLQGFVVKFLQNLTDNPSAPAQATIKFVYSGIAKNNFTQRTEKQEKQIRTSISLISDNVLKDRMWLYTNENTTYDFNNGYDGEKMFGARSLSQLYVNRGGKNYQVNSVPNINDTRIMFKPEAGVGKYTLIFNHEHTDEVYGNMYLVDMYTSQITDISADDSEYSFTSTDEGMATNRFMIITRKDGQPTEDDQKFEVYQDNTGIIFYNNSEEPVNCTMYDVAGRKTHTFHLKAYHPYCLNKLPGNGIYIVEASYALHNISKKVIIR